MIDTTKIIKGMILDLKISLDKHIEDVIADSEILQRFRIKIDSNHAQLETILLNDINEMKKIITNQNIRIKNLEDKLR